MKVKELMEKLSTVDENMDVCCRKEFWGGDTFNIRDVTPVVGLNSVRLEGSGRIDNFKHFNDIAEMVRCDLNISSPECYEDTECIHSALDKEKWRTSHSATEKCGHITRYYEDDEYVRAYCVEPYGSGIVIVWGKENGVSATFALAEDDGAWFIDGSCFGIGCFNKKGDMVACLSEALAIFNANFNDKK